jgi:hypothetical protein
MLVMVMGEVATVIVVMRMMLMMEVMWRRIRQPNLAVA